MMYPLRQILLLTITTAASKQSAIEVLGPNQAIACFNTAGLQTVDIRCPVGYEIEILANSAQYGVSHFGVCFQTVTDCIAPAPTQNLCCHRQLCSYYIQQWGRVANCGNASTYYQARYYCVRGRPASCGGTLAGSESESIRRNRSAAYRTILFKRPRRPPVSSSTAEVPNVTYATNVSSDSITDLKMPSSTTTSIETTTAFSVTSSPSELPGLQTTMATLLTKEPISHVNRANLGTPASEIPASATPVSKDPKMQYQDNEAINRSNSHAVKNTTVTPLVMQTNISRDSYFLMTSAPTLLTTNSLTTRTTKSLHYDHSTTTEMGETPSPTPLTATTIKTTTASLPSSLPTFPAKIKGNESSKKKVTKMLTTTTTTHFLENAQKTTPEPEHAKTLQRMASVTTTSDTMIPVSWKPAKVTVPTKLQTPSTTRSADAKVPFEEFGAKPEINPPNPKATKTNHTISQENTKTRPTAYNWTTRLTSSSAPLAITGQDSKENMSVAQVDTTKIENHRTLEDSLNPVLGTGTVQDKEKPGGMTTTIISSVASMLVLVILLVIIVYICRKRRVPKDIIQFYNAEDDDHVPTYQKPFYDLELDVKSTQSNCLGVTIGFEECSDDNSTGTGTLKSTCTTTIKRSRPSSQRSSLKKKHVSFSDDGLSKEFAVYHNGAYCGIETFDDEKAVALDDLPANVYDDVASVDALNDVLPCDIIVPPPKPFRESYKFDDVISEFVNAQILRHDAQAVPGTSSPLSLSPSNDCFEMSEMTMRADRRLPSDILPDVLSMHTQRDCHSPSQQRIRHRQNSVSLSSASQPFFDVMEPTAFGTEHIPEPSVDVRYQFPRKRYPELVTSFQSNGWTKTQSVDDLLGSYGDPFQHNAAPLRRSTSLYSGSDLYDNTSLTGYLRAQASQEMEKELEMIDNDIHYMFNSVDRRKRSKKPRRLSHLDL
ncbi:uncharacterized protein LOC106175740 [Lingula anatina]|uniref:Uncharacterized protein LOC106175740 n=1 Tax=Lingula anatina TaxID=7574 RepID=A0A1S3JSM4_LINAN|nr:uncharacterized protein LOC106175740 [Lingula anatina]|eukprot:XP_013413322.1 uncharacterized protein LOC106175740 [Lingula anatina]